MNLSVPTNWQKKILPEIIRPQVKEVYGKLTKDFVGGGRSLLAIPEVAVKKAEEHIKEIRKGGSEFNYLLNAVCLDNKEFTREGQKQIRKILDWLVKINVDSVTVTVPYLLQLIKKKYPKLKVYVSTMAQVNSVERARLWEDLGANRITLAHQDVNRNFELLKAIRKNVACSLQLIVNNGCIYNCPFYIYHTVLLSHASQSKHSLRGFFVDYCSLYCRAKQLCEPEYFIKNDWIRPEDIHYYEDIGYNEFKLVDREMPTERLALITDAYIKKSYNGNLLDILGSFSSATGGSNSNQKSLSKWIKIIKYLFRPQQVNISKLYKFKNILTKVPVYINNQSLDGFLEHFFNKRCDLMSCKNCNFCNDIAKRVVSIVDEDKYRDLIKNYNSILEDIVSGKMFIRK
ncbi:MAG: U32 family peptidase [Candidatus Kaelpia aquatica]|nr:U32 family peptidase [Candidatus Kaelpia aquatica]